MYSTSSLLSRPREMRSAPTSSGTEMETLVHYPEPVHWYPPYRSLGDGPVPLDGAERLCSKVVSLPIYPELRDWEVEHVATALRSFA